MVKVYSIDSITPVVHPEAYVHPSAVLIGDVIVGAGVYVGPCASLRGDFGRIVIERGANIQDGCIVHGYPGGDTLIEEDGHIGHGAIIHAAHIGRNAMVGMHAVVNDHADIGESAFVGALAFVKAGMKVAARTLAVGMPARVLRPLTDEELAWKRDATRQYQQLTGRSRASLRETVALTEVEPDRRRIELSDVLPLGAYKLDAGKRAGTKLKAENT
ncbi:MAG: phenylacetic acid degradation protein PaaY [Proteobacteria bacterium]|nr:phenylacetic acid degradation protein PaaY [Pseudomonadota bacterium]